MNRLWAVRSGTVATALVLVSGCAGSSQVAGSQAPGTTTAAAPVATGGPSARASAPVAIAGTTEQDLGRDFQLPLNAFLLTTSQTAQLSQAREAVMARCVVGQGFHYDPSKDVSLSDAPTRANIIDFGENGNRRRYGISSLAAATNYGYQLPSEFLVKVVRNDGRQNVHGFGASSPALLKAVATCLQEADKSLPNAGQIGSLVSDLKAESFTRSMTDPAVKAKFALWADCMKQKGFSETDPLKAGATVSRGQSDMTVTAAERQEAVADVTCKEQVSLLDVWFDTEKRLQEQQVAQHQEELNTVKALNERSVAAAAEALRTAPTVSVP